MHLPLVKENAAPDRRRKPSPVQPPDRGGRSVFSNTLSESLERIEEQNASRPPLPQGIQPHLVFRLPIEGSIPNAQLVQRLIAVGITVVGVEPDGAIIAFKDDANLQAFKEALETYRRGPTVDQRTGELRKTTQWDVFQWMDAANMRIWNKADRIGSRLSQKIGSEGELIEANEYYILDIELWHPGSVRAANASLAELRSLLQTAQGNQITDSFVGQLISLARVRVNGEMLKKILNLDAVAEADLPPKPVFDSSVARQAVSRNFPTPPRPAANGPRVCIVDSGIASGHPLLANNVGHAESILTETTTAADLNGHGTMVGGIAVFGDVRAKFVAGAFSSEVTLFSARVLNDQNEFDDNQLILTQMRSAVEFFIQEPHRCKVFNISLGTDSSLFADDNRRQGLWAEILDTLAREYKVLFVVSSGNHHRAEANNASDAEEILTSYPRFLLEEECRLCDPATAAIAITVGGVANSDTPEVRHGSGQQDIVRVVAQSGEPCACTRIGPGINDAIKPEFVAPAGNHAFIGTGSHCRSISGGDNGINIMSLSNEPTNQLFAFKVGTSLASPEVARIAAKVWTKLESQFPTEAHPNLVRALLGASANFTNISTSRMEALGGDFDAVKRMCGYGMIDEEYALESSDKQVTLLAQDKIKIDSFHIYEVPIPAEFHTGNQQKKIVVSLAFDPPVRRRRSQYLGVKMQSCLIRGKTLNEVIAAYRSVPAGQTEPAPGAIQGSCKCKLVPGVRQLEDSTLQKSEFLLTRPATTYGETYYLVVRSQRTWAPIEIEEQDYAIAVSLVSNSTELYSRVEERVQARIQQQARVRPRP